MEKIVARLEEYKGHALLALYEEGGDRPVISFGIRKARVIAGAIDAILAFVESEPARVEPPKRGPYVVKWSDRPDEFDLACERRYDAEPSGDR